MRDFRSLSWITTTSCLNAFHSAFVSYKIFRRSIISSRQRHYLTLLRKEQIVSTNRRWLFAESLERVVKKGGNTKMGKHLPIVFEVKTKHSPDFVIAGLRDIYQKRLAIRSDIFINSVLLPLESKNDTLIEFLQQSGDTHVPFLLSLCGQPMSDIACNKKSEIADRLWKAFIHASIPITLETIKSRLKILIENEQTFNALEILKEAKTIFHFDPDEEFFTLTLRGLSVTGNISAVNSMLREIERHKILVNIEMKTSQIYCYLKNDDNGALELVQNAVAEYGNEIEPLIFMVRCQAAIEKRDIQNFKQILSSYSSLDLSLKLLTDEMVIKLVWSLARNSNDSMGKEHEKLCTEVLRKVKKGHGFFKLMIREANRHAAHGMFYSALSYFHSDLHVSAKSTFKDLGRHMEWVGCFSKALINAELSLAELKALFAHINKNTHNAHFVLENILYAVLTDKLISVQKSLLLSLILLKMLDPNCTKIHVVVPLLVRASGVDQRLEILTSFVSAGYSNLNHLNYGVVRKLVLQPLLGKYHAGNEWNAEQLSHVVNILTDNKIPENIAYKFLEPFVKGNGSLEKWLKKRTGIDLRNCDGIFLRTLKEYISNQEVDKVHEFIKTNRSADISKLFQPIIMLYIDKANWDTLIEYIREIQDDDNSLIQLTTDNILLILVRHLEEFKSFSMSSNFVFYLQQFVAKDLPSTRNEKTMKKLIKQSLQLPHETVQSIIASLQMFRTLADVKWIQSGTFEIVSASFVSAALTKFGFEEALKVCSSFQFSDFPNGIIPLLHHSIRNGNENLTNKALALAKSYWPEWKVSVTYGSIMICSEMVEEASRLLQDASIRWMNVFQTYKLLCALHLDETRNFHFNYLSLFSKVLGYSKHDEACTRLALDCLRNCTRKDPDQAYLVKHFLKTLQYNAKSTLADE